MKLKFIIFIVNFYILLENAVSSKFSYDGYHLLRLYLKNQDDINLIQNFELSDSDFDIWNIATSHKTADVLLPPKTLEKYKQIFKAKSLTFEVIEDNIQKKIIEQSDSIQKNQNDRSILLKYARYNEILSFIDNTVADNPDLASTYTASRTFENRLLKVIVLKTASSSKSLWIDCGIHAREWVSPASCVYLIDRLIKEYRANEPTTTSILNKYEIHILPLLNPDGYEYSHSTYRLWRKNRSPNQGSTCIGTDLNRNFPFRWLTGGSSTNPCSDTFAGKSAGSELEAQAVIEAINKKAGNWDAFLSIHSYGNWWLTQWGHSTQEVPNDYNDLVAKGQIGADAIKAFNGSIFVVGSSARLLYINTGSSADWAKGAANVKYSYVLELRPGPGTSDYNYGFTLPEDRMSLVAPETYIGVKAFIKSII